MKALAFFFTLMLSLAAAASIRPPSSGLEKLRWCVDHLPERHEFDGEELTGPAVDFMQELAMRANFVLEPSPDTPFARCLLAMQEGQADIMVALHADAERAEYMHFVPLYRSLPESLFVSVSNPLEATNVYHIKDMNLGIVKDYIYNTPDIEPLIANNDVQEVDTVDAGLIMLTFAHLDALVAPTITTISMIKNHPRYQGNIQLAPVKLSGGHNTEVFLAISKNSDVSTDTLVRIEAVVDEMRAQEEILPMMFPSWVATLDQFTPL